MRNRIWAIVPVKPLYHAKSRLAAVLDTAQRQALVVALLRHTLSVLAQVDELATVLVVSADPVVCTMGRTSGARILREDRAPGLNASLNEAGDFASAGGAAGVLIIPADLPRLRPESIA
ncbi:MAG: NTP transferase domain-containing protein, partial [Anaerolineae bacterium]|nr:NTP transferase domain-containing protein [Anaerolineae bacterium]